MLDIKLIREDPDAVKAALGRRGGSFPIDAVLEVDERRRRAQVRIDELRAEQKRLGRDVAGAKGDDKQQLLGRLTDLKAELTALEAGETAQADTLRALLLQIPNLPHPDVPSGESDEDNAELRVVGDIPTFDFAVRDHLDIGVALDIIDIERAARGSGSRFAYLKNEGALLWHALTRFVLERLRSDGFSPIVPPVLVRREAMEGTGFLPTDEQQIYRTADDDLYLVGTSEVPLAALHMGEIVETVPLLYAGVSSCFRREAGTHGRDTRGIFRLHQFEKVEMFAFVHPEESWKQHEHLIALEEQILQDLEIPYRAVDVCTGELGQPAARKIDLEGWFPGQQRYREVTSCSNTTDYQARRLDCRFRADGATAFVHTLNGTAATSSRHIAVLLELNQRADGSVSIPAALRSYMGMERIARD